VSFYVIVAEMARVRTSLSERKSSGPGLLLGNWEWQKSSSWSRFNSERDFYRYADTKLQCLYPLRPLAV